MTDYTISSKLSNETVYAYYRGRFWHWNGSIWKESRIMTHRFELARAADKKLTPQEFLTNGAEFSPLDEYEIDCAMLDALESAKPCKNAPIEPVEEESECAPAQNADVAVTTAEIAVPTATAATPTISESGADVSASTPATSLQNCESAPAASAGGSSVSTAGAMQDKPLTFIREDKCPAFDYSGLTDQTVEDLHFAEDEYRHGKQMAERGLVHMGNAIAAAHDALCGVVQLLDNSKHGNRGDDSFRAWCCSIGITKSTAYNLLQVSALMDGSSPRQRAILEALPPTLLYAVAKPSAPQELVEKVKNGEVTTNKAYQDLLKENQQLRTDRVEAMNRADRERDRADRAEAREEEARQAAHTYHVRLEEATASRNSLLDQQSAYIDDINGLAEQNAQLKERVDSAEAREEEAWKMQSKAEARAKNAEEALKHQPITAVIDEEEIDRRAAEKAWGLADARNAELAKDNANLKKQVAALRSRINDDAQADFEQANYCASLMRAAWDNSKASYSRLVGEDLESTFQTICGTLNSIMEEASLLCRQPPDYDGGDRDE